MLWHFYQTPWLRSGILEVNWTFAIGFHVASLTAWEQFSLVLGRVCWKIMGIIETGVLCEILDHVLSWCKRPKWSVFLQKSGGCLFSVNPLLNISVFPIYFWPLAFFFFFLRDTCSKSWNFLWKNLFVNIWNNKISVALSWMQPTMYSIIYPEVLPFLLVP